MKFVRLFAVSVLSLTLLACQKPDKHNEKLELSDGSEISLADLSGKWLVVNYWASWCHNCKQDMKNFNALSQFDPEHIQVFGYNYMDLHGQKLLTAMKTFNIQFREFEYLPADLLGLPMEVEAVPATFIINPKGKVVKALYGPQTVAGIKKYLS